MAIDPIRPTDDSALALAGDLLRTSRSGMLATLDASGYPAASLILVATAMDGTPLTLMSALSAHNTNLERDPRGSLLLSRAGKGDPLAHPRLSIEVDAQRLDRNMPEGLDARHRLLSRHPKAALYIDFPDFSLMALKIRRASLNGGFGKAYHLHPHDLLTDLSDASEMCQLEEDALEHMNQDHAETVSLYATRLCGADPGSWRMTGLDPTGCDLAWNETHLRLIFPGRVTDAKSLHETLALLADKARNTST